MSDKWDGFNKLIVTRHLQSNGHIQTHNRSRRMAPKRSRS